MSPAAEPLTEDDVGRARGQPRGGALQQHTRTVARRAVRGDGAAMGHALQRIEREIDVARTGYKPCGDYTSILFFCISDLAAIDPMYQYSLPWFVNLFVASMHQAEVRCQPLD